MTGVEVFVLVALSVAPDRMAPRSYSSTRIELDPTEIPESVTQLAYADGNLWVGTYNGEVWHYDSVGKSRRFRLPVEARRINGAWADGASVLVHLPGQFLRLSNTGTITELGTTEESAALAIRMRDGHIGLFPNQRKLFYKTDHDTGMGRSLGFAEEPCHRMEEGQLERVEDVVEAEGRSVQRVSSVLPKARGHLGAQGYLTRIDDDRIVYIMAEPYRYWVIGLDGSTRCVDVDDTRVREVAGWAPRNARVIRVSKPGTRRALAHQGRLVVARHYHTELERTDGEKEHAKVSRAMTYSVYIDVLDLESGEVRERIDVGSDIKYPGLWAGVRGEEDLVFLQVGGEAPYISIASPR